MKKAKTHNSKFKLIVRGVLLLVLIAVLGWYGYIYTGKLLCRIAIRQIGELTGTSISTGSISYQPNGSVFINDLVIKPKESQYSYDEILNAKKVFARFDKKSLLLLKPRLSVLDVNDFVFNAIYDLDTGWSNLSDLAVKPAGKHFRKIPNINLISGLLQYVKVSDGHEEIAVSVPVDADFISDEKIPRKYNFHITTATMSSGYGQSHLSGTWTPGNVTIAGGIASLSVPKFEMAWFIDVLAAELKYDKSSNYSLDLSIKNIQSLRSGQPKGLALEVPKSVEKYGFFSDIQEFFDTYKPKGLADIALKMSGNFKNVRESEIDGSVNCKDAAFEYSFFKYPIEHLTGKINFTQEKLTLSNLIGKHGDSEISFDGWLKDFGKNHKYKIMVASDKMPLENDLYKALTDKEKRLWSSFSPDGNISVNLEIERHTPTLRTLNLVLGLMNVNAVYRSFPYPLKNLSGRLVFGDDKIKIQDVVSQNGDIRIALNGHIDNYVDDNSIYDVSIDVNNVPLDSTLEAAMQENRKKLYESLNPAGVTSGSIKVSSTDSNEMDYTADLNFKDAAIELDSLSKPVTNVSAHAVFTPDSILIRDFSGKYGDIPVSLSGQVMPDSEQQLCYDVSLNLNQIQLNNKELADFLSGSMEKIMSRFNPDGAVNLTVDLNKDDVSKSPDYNVTVNCLGNSLNLAGFPYPVTDITGKMKINSQKISLEDVSGFLVDNNQDETDRAKINLAGEIKIIDGNLNNADLNLSVKHVLLDEQFFKLLPEHCQGLYNVLSPAGCLDIDFNDFKLINGDDGHKSIDFDGAVSLGKCDFTLSSQPARLDSPILLHGSYTSGRGFSDCNIVIDNGTLNVLGKTLTGLQTEICYDPNEQKWSSQYIIAQAYGGRTTGKFEFLQKEGRPMEYVLQTSFDNLDLKQFMADTRVAKEQKSTYTTGKMSGSLDLSCKVAQNDSRIGACRVTIKDMQIGKLSPLANLLQVLNLNEPSDYAFDSMFIDSYIRRNGLVVQKLDMSGKSVAFYGSGSINLSDGGVDLSLIARGHRLATDDPSIWQSLTEGIGQAVVRMDVTGDYSNIKVATKALPALEGISHIFGTKPGITD